MNQLSKEQLVEIIIEQNKVVRELQKIILELQQQIERLKVSRDLDKTKGDRPTLRKFAIAFSYSEIKSTDWNFWTMGCTAMTKNWAKLFAQTNNGGSP